MQLIEYIFYFDIFFVFSFIFEIRLRVGDGWYQRVLVNYDGDGDVSVIK